MAASDNFYKENPSDKIWWVDDPEYVGRFLFSFDKKKTYNLFEDWDSLTHEQKTIFAKENPDLASLVEREI